MTCKNCGENLEKGSLFCEACGTATSQEEESLKQADTKPTDIKEASVKPSKGKKMILPISIGVILIMLSIGTIFGLSYMKDIKEKNNIQAAETLKTQEIADAKLLQMQEVLDVEDSFDEYIITESQKQEYAQLLKKLEVAIQDQDVTEGDKIVEAIQDFKTGIVQYSKDVLSVKIAGLQAIDMSQAFGIERSMSEEYSSEIDSLMGQGKYLSANDVVNKWERVSHMIKGNNKGELHISQVDVKAYPKVKLYLQIKDLITGESMTLDGFNQFSIMENISGTYIKQPILNALQLNEKEKLNINLTADISGSMAGEFENVKSVMKNFLNAIQFEVGDAASLITFDNNINIDVEFTSEKNKLSDAITNMQLGNMTALYDALYVAVSKTSMETGAKCVMAFTDGFDNNSTRTASDVIQLAQAYKIPVFIIGIGQNIDGNVLSNLAASTGGFYENVSSGISMETIYNEIYRQQKELYVLEYETDQSIEDIKERKVYVSYEDDTLPMRNETAFVPKDLMKEPEDYAQLINKDMMTSQDIEAEILRIRGIWDRDREAMKTNQYQINKVANGVTAYSYNGEIRMIEIVKNTNGMNYARTYNFSNGKLIFAYIAEGDAHRLYFKDDRLFRWRYTADANKRDQATNFDNMGDSEEFNKWGRFAIEEGYQVYSDAVSMVR